MVLVQDKYINTHVGVLRTKITFVTHFNSGNLGPQKTDSGVFIIIYSISRDPVSSNQMTRIYVGVI